MKARIERDELRRALKTVQPAVPRGGGLAVLQGVRIEAAEERLRLQCSDLQQTITVDVSAHVVDPGVVVAPAGLLARFVERLAVGTVELALGEDAHLEGTGGDASLNLWCLPTDEWPRILPTDGEPFTLDAEHVDLVRRILPMASTDEARPILTGLYTEGDTAVCTDSYRMGMAKLDGAALPPAIIPAHTVINALKGADGAVQVTVGERSASISHDGATWQTVLLEGDFPPVERLIPQDPPHVLTFNAERLTDALATASVVGGVDKEGNAAPVRVERDGDKASVAAVRQDVGSADQVIPCDGDFEGRLGFNPVFLASIVNAAGTEDVSLGLTDQLKPVVLRTDELTLLVMPVRIA